MFFLNSIKPEDYKTEYNIDKSHNDSEIVKYMGKDMQLGEVRKMLNDSKERRYNGIIFYDDILQYTSLGLLESVYERYEISSPIPVKPFLNRTETDGKKFICDLLKPFEVNRIMVDAVEKEEYPNIIARSPRSKNFKHIYKIRELFNNLIIVVRYDFPALTQIKRLFSECYNRKDYINVEIMFRQNKSEEEFLKSLGRNRNNYFDVVVCQNAAALFNHMEENNIEDTVVMTVFKHCGLNDEEKAMFTILENGPRKSHIYYITEGL